MPEKKLHCRHFGVLKSFKMPLVNWGNQVFFLFVHRDSFKFSRTCCLSLLPRTEY